MCQDKGMVNFYIYEQNSFNTIGLNELESAGANPKIVWVDMLQPTPDEITKIEGMFKLEIPSKHEREEIELSSRYWEDETSIMINAYFFVSFFFADDSHRPYNETVTFILQDDILFTIRDTELTTFTTVHAALMKHTRGFENGYDIIMHIFDIRIDTDADLLEYAAKESDDIRNRLLWEPSGQSIDTLRKISTLQQFTAKVRQSVFDKRRILTALAKSTKLTQPLKEELSIMMKDINSLVEFLTINGNTLDNLQNLFLAQTNIEQNKIIKLFTVASVVLMPPTLIASIYGMNFHFIPELAWRAGYPFSLMMMAIAGAVPLIYFRKRGWL